MTIHPTPETAPAGTAVLWLQGQPMEMGPAAAGGRPGTVQAWWPEGTPFAGQVAVKWREGMVQNHWPERLDLVVEGNAS